MENYSHDMYTYLSDGRQTLRLRLYQGVYMSTVSPRVFKNGRWVLKLVDNPLGYYRYRTACYPAIATKWNGNEEFRAVPIPGYGPVDLARQSYLVADARNQCLAAAHGFTANLGEMFATRKQTIDMVTGNVKRLFDVWHHIRNRDFARACNTMGISYKKPRRSSRTPGDVWLEYQYGWKPLVQDVYKICNQPFPEPTQQVRGSSHLYYQTDSDIAFYHQTETFNYKCRSKGECYITEANVAAISSFGVNNPASLAWELLPFSFVVDWFLPVGDYLTQLTAGNGFSMRKCSTSFSCEINNHRTWTIPDDPSYTLSNKVASCEAHYILYERTIGSFQYSFPHFKSPISTTHFANALSLLAGGMSNNKFRR